MVLIWNGRVAVLLLAITQNSVSASLDNVNNKTEALSKMIFDCVKVSWLKGHDWLLHSSESPRVEKIRTLIRGIESGETWALKTLDTLLKIEREVPTKNIHDTGIDDVRIEMDSQDRHINIQDNSCRRVSFEDIFRINGERCGLSSSACHPSSNNEINPVQIVNDAVLSSRLGNELNLGGSNLSQLQVESKDFTMVEICTILLFAMVGAFMIACTICDIVGRTCRSRNLSRTMNMLSKFSLYTNALALLSTKVTPNMMPAIHGIRCLTFCSVIIGHRYILSAIVLGNRITLLEFLEAKTSWLGIYMIMTQFTVDTFFIISGFLVTYLFFKAMDSGMKLNLPMMYLHRYFRVTPCLAALVLFAGVLSHRGGSGPLWEAVLNESVNHCPKNWWLYLLYVQNLVKNGYMCLPHPWYLAADMQLFWISPVILYPLYRSPKFGLGILSLFFVGSLVTPATILAINGYSNASPRLDMDASKQVESFENYYISTYTRVFPYLVGILFGYNVAKKTKRLTQVNVAINWLVASTLILFCLWSTIRIYNTNFAYNLGLEIAFTVIVRPSWAIAMAWIIYACTQGYGGLVTRFLSLPIFFPLSRLAYCIYLVHPVIQAITIISSPTSTNYSSFGMICLICNDLGASIAVAFVFSLFIESPVIVLAKILTNRSRHSKGTTPVQNPQKSKEVRIKSH